MAIEIQPKHKFDGTAAPAITDDRDDGYSEGSRWINVLTGIEYLCVDATVGEARWAVMPYAGIDGVAGLRAAFGGLAGVRTPTRFVLFEDFALRPALAAAIDPSTAADPSQAEIDAIFAANKHWEVAGTNMTTALATHAANVGGLVVTTAGADDDQAIVQPRTNPAAVTRWGTGFDSDQKPRLSLAFSLPSVAVISVKAGLALTNTHDLATDADQVGLWFNTDTGGNFLGISSIGGTDATIDTGVTPGAATEYRVDFDIQADRTCIIYINGARVATTGALTTNKNLIPFFSIQARDTAAKAAHLRWVAASMEMAA